MFETPRSSKNHSNPVFITGADYLLIADRPTGLDHYFDTRICDGINAVPKWEECVRSQYTALYVYTTLS